MISDETNILPEFTRLDDGSLEISYDNVRLAETVFALHHAKDNNLLRITINSLRYDYSNTSIEAVITAINKTNSTHIRNETEKPAIANSIFQQCHTFHDLTQQLLETNDNGEPLYPLVTLIRELHTPDNIIRNNYSFATKFCHYCCYYLFEDDISRDKYPIYDSIVSKYINKYYNNEGIDLSDYPAYVALINNILEGTNISKNGFDHLIWLAER